MSTVESSQRKPAWSRLFLIAGSIVALDQLTKFLAVKRLTFAFDREHATTLSQQFHVFYTARHLMDVVKPPFYSVVIPHFWNNRYAENPGAAWSLLASWPESTRVPFFHVVSFLAVALIGWYYSRLQPGQGLLSVALSLVMAGAIGNLIDRLARQYVIDFIDWHLNDPQSLTKWHWPTFNVADTGISVGVTLIFLDAVISWSRERSQDAGQTQSARA